MSSNAKKGTTFADRVSFPDVKKAANLLISTIKTPEHFLEFLIEAAHWTAKIEDKETRENACFFLRVIAEDIAIPWLYSITKHKPLNPAQKAQNKPLAAVMEGIANLHDVYEHQDFFNQICRVSEAFSSHFLDIGTPTPDYFDNISKGMNGIWLLWRPIHNLHFEFDLKRKG